MLSTTILCLTAFFLITGALLGFGRGAVRSVLRFITVGASFLIAWLGKKAYVAAVLNIEVDGGMTIAEKIAD